MSFLTEIFFKLGFDSLTFIIKSFSKTDAVVAVQLIKLSAPTTTAYTTPRLPHKNIIPKGCGGGSDVCRSLAAYGTATKAGQKMNIA